MKNKLGQECAFPFEQKDQTGSHWDNHFGMSKRYITAKDCLCAMLGNMQFLEANANTAKQQFMKADEFLVFTAYSLADELLRQENE